MMRQIELKQNFEYSEQARIIINSKRYHQRWLTNNKDRKDDFQEEVMSFHPILRFTRCCVVIYRQVYGNREPTKPIIAISRHHFKSKLPLHNVWRFSHSRRWLKSNSHNTQALINEMENFTKEEYGSIQNLYCTDQSLGNHPLLLSIIHYFLSVTAFLGNTLILVASRKESSLHPPSKLLYCTLATTDLLVGLISEPSAAVYSMTLQKERDRKHWLGVCFYSAAVSTVSFTILCTVSLLTLAAISVDRLLALLSGVRYRHIVTVERTRAVVISFWISSIVFASFSVWKYKIPFSFRHGIILVCLLISAACYSKIYLVLRQRLHVNHEETANAGEILANIARYRKTVFTALWVQLTLVICYLPYSIVIVIVTVNGSSTFLHALWGFSAALVYLNSTLNPVLYCWKIRSFRKAVKDTVKQLWP